MAIKTEGKTSYKPILGVIPIATLNRKAYLKIYQQINALVNL